MKTISGAKFVIKRIGGLTRTARGLASQLGKEGFAVSTVQGWSERDLIPQQYWNALIEVAARGGVTITLQDFLVEHPDPDAIAVPAESAA